MVKITWSVVAAIAALVLTLAACGGAGANDSGVATLTGEDESRSPRAGGTTEAPTDPREAHLAFAECMREQGLDFPDPEFGADGSISIQLDGEGGMDPQAEEFQAAEKACRHLLANAEFGGEPPDPERMREVREHALAFAQCMREQGLDWPDPQFDENGLALIEPPERLDPDDPRLRQATEACEEQLGVEEVRP